ncbi:MAG TPA: hypothetical protein VHV77_15445 [Pirellulales bacterium]|nr:hypothetical protein [Pirellulales bacterium]
MLLLTQFLLRLSLGMAAAMTLVSPRQVTSGYYRNNMYVLLGLNVLAALVAIQSSGSLVLWPPIVAAVLSYVGAVGWLYGSARVGMISLALVAVTCLVGAWLDLPQAFSVDDPASVLRYAAVPSGGLVLGVTMAAMLLGHWYLNAPGMRIAPLQRLIAVMMAAIVLRAVVSGVGLAFLIAQSSEPTVVETLASHGVWMLALRWLTGIVGSLITAAMAWQTLKIPNTQSATGILYVGVMFTFLGELTAELLSTDAVWSL